MRLTMLVAALALMVPTLPAPPPATAAETTMAGFSVTELMQATALDLIFDQFRLALSASARINDISTDEIFLSHWDAAAASAFYGPALRSRLANSLSARLTAEACASLGGFFRSDFGLRISALEREAAELDAEAQANALADGERISSEAGPVRSTQLDDLMDLMGAEISGLMAGQSMRALLLGMSVAHQTGDIEVPWEEIDAQVEAMLPSLAADQTRAQRAMMAYAYRQLSDDELDRYIVFLRTAPARTLYAVAADAIGQIIVRSVGNFGEALADRMASVNV